MLFHNERLRRAQVCLLAAVIAVSLSLLNVWGGLESLSRAPFAEGIHTFVSDFGIYGLAAIVEYRMYLQKDSARLNFLATRTIAAMLVLTGILATWFAVERWFHPHEIDGGIVIIVTGIALLGNILIVLLLQRAGGHTHKHGHGHSSSFTGAITHAGYDSLLCFAAFFVGVMWYVAPGATWIFAVDPLATGFIAFGLLIQSNSLWRKANTETQPA